MRFDVFTLPNGVTPYVVDVQSDFISRVASRVVIPIIPETKLRERIKDLHPIVEINGERCVLVTHQITSILQRNLRRPIASLIGYRDEITRALDLLFTGF
jgi:toxin CcdB